MIFCWSDTEHGGGAENVGKALSLAGARSEGCGPTAPRIAVYSGPFSGSEATPAVLRAPWPVKSRSGDWGLTASLPQDVTQK